MSFIFGCSLDGSTTPALSPPPPPPSPLAFATLSPPQSCSYPALPLPVWRQWWGRGYWCADVFSANIKTVKEDPSTSSPATTTSRPPQAMSRRGSGPSDYLENNYSFTSEVKPTWTPNVLSLLGHQICYILMSMWIRETFLDSYL
jgi:hypothetical protein